MANHIYPSYKTAILTAANDTSLDQDNATDGVYCALIDVGVYTYSPSHVFYSELSGVVGTDLRVTSPIVTDGTFDGDDLVFTSVAGNAGAIVLYRHNAGANSTWRLVLYRDASGVAVGAGNNITLTWNVNGIFTL